jgi:hypothetical protein
MASQIGVQLYARQSDNTDFNTAISFTVSAGETTRVFIVRTGHSVVNPTIVPSGVFIVGTTNFTYGSVILNPVATIPQVKSLAAIGGGYRDITMLSFFGGVVFDSATTGFAMEFIGDARDAFVYIDSPTVSSGVH